MNQNQLATPDAPIVRLCQVEDMSTQLEASIETLHGAVKNLIDRLSPVTRPSSPASGESCKMPPREMLVPIAEQFRLSNDKVQQATAMVCDILSRLELP